MCSAPPPRERPPTQACTDYLNGFFDVDLTAPDDSAPDDDDDDDGDDSDAGATAGSRAKRRRIGTMAQRRAQRLLKSNIMSDIENGCGCGCLDELSYNDVHTQRLERDEEDAKGHRDYIRGYIEHNPADTKLGVNLHTRAGAKLCAIGFDVYNGFAPGYTWRFIRAHKVRVCL